MKHTRRSLLRVGAGALGAAGISRAAFPQLLSLAGSMSHQGLSLDVTAAGSTIKAVPVKINVAAGNPIRTMRGGLGASFRTVSKELPSKKPGRGDSWSGSEWGGNPDPEDNKHWDDLFRYAEWLGLDWCRVEFEQATYEPEKRKFDWDSPDMRVVYKILDWADKRGVDVCLIQMWSDVAWNAFPENATDPVRILRSGPRDINEWAFGLGELVEHLTKVKKYRCLRWLIITDEPGTDDYAWWQDANIKALPLPPGLKAAREELDRRGLSLPLAGPDWAFVPRLDPSKIDIDSYVGAYDLHCYFTVFDSMIATPSFPSPTFGAIGLLDTLATTEKYLAEWAKWAHDKNKPFFLTEFGSFAFGWGHDDLGPACYESGLKNASLVVRGINAGVDGFNRWSFTNRGDLDGQWQLVRTWDIEANKLLNVFEPQPNAFYQYAMLTRFLPKNSRVLATRVDAPFEPEDRKLVATALRSPKGNTTVLVVNENYHPADVTIDFDGLDKPTKMQRYAFTTAERDKAHVDIKPERSFSVNAQLSDHVPPTSIVVYSTYNLGPGDPGIISE